MPADTTHTLIDADSGVSTPDAETKRSGVAALGYQVKKHRWLIGAAVVAIVAAAILFNPFAAPKTQMVTAAVTRGDLEQTVLATGVLEPAKLINVGAQASGQVKKLYVELGDTVKAGDPIADIDARTQTNTVQNAQASLSNVTAQRSAANASLTEAQLNHDRQKRLYDAGAAAKADLDSAEAQLANARASLAAAGAQIKQANLTLNTAETNLGYTKIVAPMDGTIVAIVTEEGQTVNANQSAPTIVMLAQLDKMTVSAEISEADVPKVTEGQEVYFTTLGDTRTKHYAQLRTVAPAPTSIETTTSSSSSSSASAVYYNGLFDVDNADGRLKTGMTAQVNIVLASAKDAIMVPASALERKARNEYAVKVVKENGEVEQRAVKVGISTSVTAQVTDGLKEGEKVVVAEGSTQKAGSNQQTSNPLMPGGGTRRGMNGGGGPRQ